VGTTGLKPRKYQLDALRWALARKRAVVSMPTGAGKTLIAVMWVEELLKSGKSKKVLVLEPTRILVEQVARYFNRVSRLRAAPVHGGYPKQVREGRLRRASVVVATPESALSEVERIRRLGFNAVVIDECHHTTGEDAYLKLMRELDDVLQYRLGLTAYIPRGRVAEIKRFIGEVRVWSWSDPDVRPYVPRWIGEVYESELNESERNLLLNLEKVRETVSGRLRALVGMAIRWFVRDGYVALQESLRKATLLARVIGERLPWAAHAEGVRPAHKLEALERALRDHEGFGKALVFIDRVAVAKYVAGKVGRFYRTQLLCGKTHLGSKLRDVLRRIKALDVKVIVSTSAGEEGLDLPECDLLIIWSNTSSPLRFIQRHGRILRAASGRATGPPKFVVYIVTPETVDTDSFVDALESAKRAGVDIPLDREAIEYLWRRSRRARILEALAKEAMPVAWVAEAFEMSLKDAKDALRALVRHGDVIYIYTPLGKVYVARESLDILIEKFSDCLNPNPSITGKVKVRVRGRWVSLRGGYDRAFKLLRAVVGRGEPLEEILVSVEAPLPGGALKLVNLRYGYAIYSEDLLKIVLSNAFSENVHSFVISD